MRARWAHRRLRMWCAFVISTKKETPTRKRRRKWKSITGMSRPSRKTTPSRRFLREPPRGAESDSRGLHEGEENRRTTQPAAKSAGCIFKNPTTIPAGKLVDELGLKNTGVGKARVSEIYGNFIVKDGGRGEDE